MDTTQARQSTIQNIINATWTARFDTHSQEDILCFFQSDFTSPYRFVVFDNEIATCLRVILTAMMLFSLLNEFTHNTS